MVKSKTSQWFRGSRSPAANDPVHLVAVAHESDSSPDQGYANRLNRRHIRTDAILGILLASVLTLAYFQLDLGERLGKLTANVELLSSELIKP